MTHDPLCPTHKCIPSCQCDIIAKVRADERDRCIEIVSDTYTENWRDCAWNSAVAWALTQLRGEPGPTSGPGTNATLAAYLIHNSGNHVFKRLHTHNKPNPASHNPP